MFDTFKPKTFDNKTGIGPTSADQVKCIYVILPKKNSVANNKTEKCSSMRNEMNFKKRRRFFRYLLSPLTDHTTSSY